MNDRMKRLLQPGTRLYFVLLIIFAAATVFFEAYILAACEAALIVLLLIYSIIMNRRRRKELLEYIESVTYDAETAKNDTLVNFPLPMVAFKLENSEVVWGNKYFFDIVGANKNRLDMRMTELVPGFKGKWLTEGKQQYPDLVYIGDKRFKVFGNIVRGESENARDFMGMTYWLDVTEDDKVREEYINSRPNVAIILFDNFDEITKNQTDRQKAEMRNQITDCVENWCAGKDAIVTRIDKDKYLFVFEDRYYNALLEEKFSLLEQVRKVISPGGVHATISIGIGRDGGGFEENLGFAKLSADMALSRGGDQCVVKNRFNFEFYGGRGDEVETRTKVKSRVMANSLGELMKTSDQVLIMGHKFGDMDCVGAATGICCMSRKLGKKVHVVIDMNKNAAETILEKLKSTPEYEDVFIDTQEAMLRAGKGTLLVVVDTNRPEQTEDANLLLACNRIAVIDHHRRTSTFIQNAALTFIEPYASSVCELICELLQEMVESTDILKIEADAMLAGIVMDTKNFSIRTGERTFDAAAYLRRAGADTISVKKYLQQGLDDTVERYRILQQVRRYRDNIAVAVCEEPQDRTVAAQAADEMLNITGITASIVIYPTEKGGVIVSARSIGDINVQVLLEELGGGGNKSAAGLQMEDISLRDGVNLLFAAIDKYLEE